MFLMHLHLPAAQEIAYKLKTIAIIIVACYHPLPLPACMLHFNLAFVTSISVYILQHFSENVLHFILGTTIL